MKKSMIYLEELQFEKLKVLSRERGKSLASLIREALDRFLSSREKSADADPLLQMVGIGKSKKSNRDSEDHDDILYKGKDS